MRTGRSQLSVETWIILIVFLYCLSIAGWLLLNGAPTFMAADDGFFYFQIAQYILILGVLLSLTVLARIDTLLLAIVICSYLFLRHWSNGMTNVQWRHSVFLEVPFYW